MTLHPGNFRSGRNWARERVALHEPSSEDQVSRTQSCCPNLYAMGSFEKHRRPLSWFLVVLWAGLGVAVIAQGKYLDGAIYLAFAVGWAAVAEFRVLSF